MKARIVAASLASILCASPFAAQGQGKACALATPGELEPLLGGKPTLAPAMMGDVEACNAKVGKASAMIRLFKRTDDPSGKAERAGIDAVKKMGATVETRTFGPVSCMAITPGPQMAAFGFTTSCTVAKPPTFAVIEVTTDKQATPIDKLRPVAEKMSSRF